MVGFKKETIKQLSKQNNKFALKYIARVSVANSWQSGKFTKIKFVNLKTDFVFDDYRTRPEFKFAKICHCEFAK